MSGMLRALGLFGTLTRRQRPHNLIRNSTMQGAVAGTPGTLPTNCSVFPTAGLTRSVVGIGAENGINYIDVCINGTATATALSVFYFESNNGVAAVSGQTWTQSAYIKIVAGSLSGLSFVVGVDELNSSSGYLAGSVTAITPNATLSRVSHTRTLTNASTAFLRPFVYSSVANGAAIDITLRIGGPQLNQGDLQPYRPTVGAAV